MLAAAFVAAGALAISPAYADEVYLYVDTSGSLSTEIADSPQEAINDAENIAMHSGVMVVEEAEASLLSVLDDEEQTYLYVDVSGTMQTVVAESPQAAIMEASDIAPNSGVLLLQ